MTSETTFYLHRNQDICLQTPHGMLRVVDMGKHLLIERLGEGTRDIIVKPVGDQPLPLAVISNAMRLYLP